MKTWFLHRQIAQPCRPCLSVSWQNYLSEVLVLDPHGGEDDGGDVVAPVEELLHEGSKEEQVALGAKAMEDQDVMGLDNLTVLGCKEGE